MSKQNEYRSMLLQFLAANQPCTAAKMYTELNISPIECRAALHQLRKRKPQRVYIQGWARTTDGGHLYIRPLYALGASPDAPRSVRPLTLTEYQARARMNRENGTGRKKDKFVAEVYVNKAAELLNEE